MSEEKQNLIEVLRSHLGDTYCCSRVWVAWQHNTMTEDDFSLASEDDELLDCLAQEILDEMNKLENDK